MLDLSQLTNPIWERSDNLRDPAVLRLDDGAYQLFYSRYSNRDWGRAENWAIAAVRTRDFVTFEDDRDLSPKGFASPGDPIRWHGRYLLPYQSYPVPPARLCYSESADGRGWSSPRFFLPEANQLPWNTRRRALAPSFVVDGDTLHCYFVGSCERTPITSGPRRALSHANLLGHAVTDDPALERWTILTQGAPLIGMSERAPDGVENVSVLRTGAVWTMIYSEGLAEQHLAYAVSQDLTHWTLGGEIQLPVQTWMAGRYGAPFIWREGDLWLMLLMGEDAAERTRFGLFTSADALHWQPLPERA